MTDWESYKPLAQILGGILGILVAYIMFYIDESITRRKEQRELEEYKKNLEEKYK